MHHVLITNYDKTSHTKHRKIPYTKLMKCNSTMLNHVQSICVDSILASSVEGKSIHTTCLIDNDSHKPWALMKNTIDNAM